MAGDVAGQPFSRGDARLKVTGAATYAAEHRPEGLLYGVIVNAAAARGKVSAIATDAARAHPGVLHVLTDFSSLNLAHSVTELTFYGQPIAVVLATTAEAAAHGASLVEAAYDRRPTLTDFDDPRAMSVTAPSNPDYSRGDPDGALGSAHAKVDLEFTISRENHNPIELPSTIARWEGDKLTLWDKSQWVQGAARSVAGALGISEQDVRVHCEYVGGGFGSAIRAYDHVVLAAFAARHARRPVKVVLSRRQSYYGTGYRPASRQRLALGAGTTGRIESLIYEVRTETSRYEQYEEGLTDLPKFFYGVPHTRTRYRLTAIDTQSPASMRGPGVVSSAFALETAVDQLAHDLGIDPIELRLRNEPTRDEVTRLPFSTRRLRECYDLGARRFGWSRRAAAPGDRRDGDLLIGMGMATASYHNNRRQVGSRARVAVADPASPLYRADPAKITVRDGRLSTGANGAADSYREILGRAGLPGLEATATWGPGDTDQRISSYGYGAVFAEVSVDPLLGLVRIRRMFAAYDVGRVISPKLAHSQAIGGMVGGIGMALLEGTATDHRDGRIVNAGLADYLVPVNADVPELDAAFIDTEDPLADPIGVKGLGEITIVGVPAAIGNAVFNATGKRLTDLPIRLEALL
ncbi:xanthine dehydrogenase family protein molybdopterin-binding subunit [Streptomyces sp. NPDC059989]|uniref:xanthine dehydrogenase family protein molybdopterin-binding subunit n=1 Tax=Streptomyces sp. NPDC059989 TaxID=3347026 RepID=UPI0036B6676A